MAKKNDRELQDVMQKFALTLATQLVTAVRDDDADTAATLIAPLSEADLYNLVVVLANAVAATPEAVAKLHKVAQRNGVAPA